MRVVAVIAATLVLVGSAFASPSSIRPLTAPERAAVLEAHEYHAGCPVALSQLRLLTVRYVGFDRRSHWGKLVVNARVASDLG
ncbi:MAG TPA: hypothetical protein VH538_06135, partial [Gaiellaceae bacterium]